ncbi:MAG: cation:proton antiporter [Methanotrichaceae archaeon]
MRHGLGWKHKSLLLGLSLALAALWFSGIRRELVLILLQITLMLIFASIFGGLVKRLHQPPVLGEILGGIVLGPTIMGTLFPGIQTQLFPSTGESYQVLHSIASLGLIAFIFTAGLEIDLTYIRRNRRGTLITSIFGIILPFIMGLGLVVFMPGLWKIPSGDLGIFAIFMGTALSISALPVIARILIDLDLLKKELGGIIIGAATIDDIVGWSIFALILSSLNMNINLGLNLGLTIGVLLVTVCILYIIGLNKSWQKSPFFGAVIDLTAIAMLAGAAVSEFIGAHGISGAFLAGVILSGRVVERNFILRKTYLPVMVVLAPIYFTSIGLKTNFVANFDPMIVVLVFIVACAGKILGACLGAIASGIPRRTAMAIGSGLNARGAMEIVLASAALDYGLIEGRVFVALVVMALATTVITGLTLPWLMKTRPISLRAWDPLPLHEQLGSYNYLEN